MEDAPRIACRGSSACWRATTRVNEIDAYSLLTQAGRPRLGNMVDPKYAPAILKSYFA